MSVNQPINNRKEYEKMYSKEMKNFLSNLELEAGTFATDEITPEFFVTYGLNNKETILYMAVNSYLDESKIINLSDEMFSLMKQMLSPVTPSRKITQTSEFINIIKKANKEVEMNDEKLLTSDYVLLAILSEENEISSIFAKYGITYGLFSSLIRDVHKDINTVADKIEKPEKKVKMTNIKVNGMDVGPNIMTEISNLLGGGIFGSPNGLSINIPGLDNEVKTEKEGIDYCIDLTKMAKDGKIDKITGREKEINTIIGLLNRRKNNNIVIVGDDGVGKTALIEGLAMKIANEEIPTSMLNKKIWKLNPSAIIAGTQFRGMFEERMLNLIFELKKNKNIILFIDNIQTLTTPNKQNDYDVLGMLNEVLVNGDVQVIVTTNHKGYRNSFEAGTTYSSKFQKIILEKPSKEECFVILTYLKDAYEKHHNVKYSDDIIKKCIELADRYITDHTLPTSAIDLMDEVGSYCSLKYSFPISVQEYKSVNSELNKELKNAIKTDEIEKAEEIKKTIEEVVGNIAKIGRDNWNIVEKGVEVYIDDLNNIVSNRTGIPINKLTVNDKQRLKNIDSELKKYIIGQDEAINTISNAIKRNKMGLSKRNKPSSFLLIGQSGVGKTLLAKKIAEVIYGDEKYLVRFDMSEYADKTSVNKLIGSSSGYVGYDDGGLLTEAIKKNKYSVLLIDEIEKANDDVYNIFLQVLDEGVLTDNAGRKVDFKNTIIIMTSNIGTKRASMEKFMGLEEENGEKYKTILESELKNKFPPEFINRIDSLIYFNNLTDEDLKGIIEMELQKIIKNFNREGYEITFNENIVNYLYETISNEREYGARPIMRALQNEIENKVIDCILENDEKKKFDLKIEDEKIIVV